MGAADTVHSLQTQTGELQQKLSKREPTNLKRLGGFYSLGGTTT